MLLTSLQSRSSSSSNGLRARHVLTVRSLSELAVAAGVVVGTGLHRPVAVAVRVGDRRWRVSVLGLTDGAGAVIKHVGSVSISRLHRGERLRHGGDVGGCVVVVVAGCATA